MINEIANAAATLGAVDGFIAGTAVTSGVKLMRIVCKILWREFCMFAAKMHVPQKALDKAGEVLLEQAQPAIDAAIKDGQAALKADEATVTVNTTIVQPQP